MKTILMLMLLLPVTCLADDWTTADTKRETAWHAINLIDWGQTLDIVRDQEAGRDRHERNPILGKNPSRGKVNTYFALSHLAHYGISSYLTNYRTHWQHGTIGVSGFIVGRNFYIGLSLGY